MEEKKNAYVPFYDVDFAIRFVALGQVYVD